MRIYLLGTPISVDEKRSMTKRLLKSIQEQSMSKTFVEVAESVGVDEKTIRNVFKDYVALKEREYQFETPKLSTSQWICGSPTKTQ